MQKITEHLKWSKCARACNWLRWDFEWPMKFGVWMIVFWLALSPARELQADAVWIVGSEQPVFGLIVEKQASGRLKFKKFEKGTNQFKGIEFSNDEVVLVLPTIDQKRLASLRTEKLSEWQEYAEELLGYPNDPVAKSLAFRLTLLCLHHGAMQRDSETVLESAGRNLPLFAKDADQKRAFSRLAFLYCGDELLVADEQGAVDVAKRLTDFELRLVQSVRRQQFHRAATQLNSNEFKSSIRGYIPAALLREIRRAVADKRVPEQLLVQLVAVEKAIKLGESPDGVQSTVNPFKSQQRRGLDVPMLDEISPFDLQATEFDAGVWRRPALPLLNER